MGTMTTDCPDADVLLALGTALDWETDGTLDHVASCGDCRAQLRELAELRHLATEDLAPRSGFVDEVVRALPVDRNESPWVARLTFGLVASCATAAALSAASFGVSGGRMLTALPVVALLAGATATVWLGRPRAEAVVPV
jgi:hypothetical protein